MAPLNPPPSIAFTVVVRTPGALEMDPAASLDGELDRDNAMGSNKVDMNLIVIQHHGLSLTPKATILSWNPSGWVLKIDAIQEVSKS